MKMTATENLASKMTVAKKGMNQSLKGLKANGEDASKRHDEVAGEIAAIDKKLTSDPDNAELQKEYDDLLEVKKGLLATIEYCEGMVELNG